MNERTNGAAHDAETLVDVTLPGHGAVRPPRAVAYSPGQNVRLNVPENPRLNRCVGTVKQVTGYGALVAVRCAATGEFRALPEELEPVDDDEPPHTLQIQQAARAVDQGYTGDVCSTCGGVRMRRSGTCGTCEDCGTSGGC